MSPGRETGSVSTTTHCVGLSLWRGTPARGCRVIRHECERVYRGPILDSHTVPMLVPTQGGIVGTRYTSFPRAWTT